MKITKEYLKEVIKEELSQAADTALDKETAADFNIPPTDKEAINGVQSTMTQLKKIKAVPGTVDNDMDAIVDMAPAKVKQILRLKLGQKIRKDSIK